MAEQLDSIAQASMLVRSSLASHGELIGTLPGGTAVYAHNDGTTKTVVVRPAGPRPEGVVPFSYWRMR